MFLNKENPVPEVESVQDIGVAFKEWALTDIKLKEKEAEINAQINELKDKLQRQAEPLRNRCTIIQARIEDFIDENDSEVFNGKASREWQFGICKKSTSKETVLNADPEQPKTVELLLKLPKAKREKLLKMTPSVKKPELKKLDADEMAKYNAKVKEKTNYTATIKEIAVISE